MPNFKISTDHCDEVQLRDDRNESWVQLNDGGEEFESKERDRVLVTQDEPILWEELFQDEFIDDLRLLIRTLDIIDNWISQVLCDDIREDLETHESEVWIIILECVNQLW